MKNDHTFARCKYRLYIFRVGRHWQALFYGARPWEFNTGVLMNDLCEMPCIELTFSYWKVTVLSCILKLCMWQIVWWICVEFYNPVKNVIKMSKDWLASVLEKWHRGGHRKLIWSLEIRLKGDAISLCPIFSVQRSWLVHVTSYCSCDLMQEC